MRPVVYITIGTRPDAIKVAPIFKALKRKTSLEVKLISTGQHAQLATQALEVFSLKPDLDFGVMKTQQSLSGLTRRILAAWEQEFKKNRPSLVLGHGDTTTCFATALACFYHRIPFAHIEAGLRTYRLDSPYPEEFNRQVVAQISSLHFSPSEQAKRNLMEEGVDPARVVITGNSALDSLEEVRSQLSLESAIVSGKKALVTLHRRESDVTSLKEIASRLRSVAEEFRDVRFVLPLHPNPDVQTLVKGVFGSLDNFEIHEPMPYPSFIRNLLESQVVLTDSGGVQEEAEYLGRNVLLLRDHTERQEGLLSGAVRILKGTHQQLLSLFAQTLISSPQQNLAVGAGASAMIAEMVEQSLIAS